MSTDMQTAAPCPLCTGPGGTLLWQDADLRVVAVQDADYPGFTRVIWQGHVAEMTDLTPAQRDSMMRVVYCVETVMRRELGPDKINLAAFGNMVPHLHWHVIARWRDDRHFPDAYWAAPRVAHGTESDAWRQRLARRHALVAAFHAALKTALATPAS